MPIVKLKNGSEKFINDTEDLRNLIFEELGSDVEEEYMKIIEMACGLTKKVEFLEHEIKTHEEENKKIERDNIKLQGEINILQESLEYVKETIKTLQKEYKNNEAENRKMLNVITRLERDIY